MHLSNLPENLAFFSGAIDEAGSFGGIYQSAVLAYGSDLIKDPLERRPLRRPEVPAGGREDRACSRTRRSRSRRSASAGGTSLETNPLLSKDIRFLFEPNTATLDMSVAGQPQEPRGIKKLLQVSPGSTLLLRGHVDNALVERVPEAGRRGVRAHAGAEGDGAQQEPRGGDQAPAHREVPGRSRSASTSSAAAGKSRPAPTRRRTAASKCSGSRLSELADRQLSSRSLTHVQSSRSACTVRTRDRTASRRREMMQRSLAGDGRRPAERPVRDAAVRARPCGPRRRRRRAASAAWPRPTSCRKAGYDVTVVEARNRVGGRVISFSDMVPGKNVEGGGELVGIESSDVARLRASSSSSTFLDVTEEDARGADRAGGKRLTSDESEALWEEMEKAFNRMLADAAKVATRSSRGRPPNAEALDQRSIGVVDRRPRRLAALQARRCTRMMTADNGVDHARGRAISATWR